MFPRYCPPILEQIYNRLFSADMLLVVGITTETSFLKIYTGIIVEM